MTVIFPGAWSLRPGAGLRRGCHWATVVPKSARGHLQGTWFPSLAGVLVRGGRGAGSMRRGSCQKRNPLLLVLLGSAHLCLLTAVWSSDHACAIDPQGQLPRLQGSWLLGTPLVRDSCLSDFFVPHFSYCSHLWLGRGPQLPTSRGNSSQSCDAPPQSPDSSVSGWCLNSPPRPHLPSLCPGNFRLHRSFLPLRVSGQADELLGQWVLTAPAPFTFAH